MHSDLFQFCSDFFRFALIRSFLFSEQVRTNQGNPFLRDPFANPRSQLIWLAPPGRSVSSRSQVALRSFNDAAFSDSMPDIAIAQGLVGALSLPTMGFQRQSNKANMTERQISNNENEKKKMNMIKMMKKMMIEEREHSRGKSKSPF